MALFITNIHCEDDEPTANEIKYVAKNDSKYLVPYADFDKDLRIADNQNDQSFTFHTDSTAVSDNDVKIIKIHSIKIDFIPKETVGRFPKFDMVWISDKDLTSLNAEYLQSLLRKVNETVTGLSFDGCHIKHVDKKAHEILKGMTRVDFSGNSCVKTDFESTHHKFDEKDMKHCNSGAKFAVPAMLMALFSVILSRM